ncbi:MAG: hypothetical protein EP298_01140 [Gammaproteobacteria bacterium]|nr:MAG: hypothetical protein EP298_01140 [Gammaproteobacteria bacterium]UTW41956.1 hypothetical protein KFE69_10650 [bacterium SCSIO 12844]
MFHSTKITIQISPSTIQAFIPVANLQWGDYPMVFAITKDMQGQFVLRGFYKSNSESHWRAFCGLRRKGAIMKGCEFDPKRNAGYIHEALVIPELDLILNNFSEVNHKDAINKIDDILNIESLKQLAQFCGLPNSSMEKYTNFINSLDGSKGHLNQFALEYSNVTQCFDVVNLKTVDDSKKYVANIQMQLNEFMMPESMKSFQDNILIPGITLVSQGEAISLGYNGNGSKFQHNLTKDYYMRFLFKVALKRENGELHPQEDQLIISYALRIETDPTCRDDLFNYQGYIERVYWQNSPINDFGIRAEIPSDLSYLVQKPMDYSMQVHMSNRGKYIDDRYVDLLDFNAKARLNQVISSQIKSGLLLIAILNELGINDPQADELKNSELLRDSVSMLYFNSIDFKDRWDILKSSNNLQKAISIFYLNEVIVAFNETGIGLEDVWLQVKDNENMQKAVTAFYDYMTSGAFGEGTKHGAHGREQAIKFIIKLMQLDEKTSNKIKQEMQNWIRGYGLFGCSSNLEDKSRISYCHDSGLLIQQPEILFADIAQANRKDIKRQMLEA